MIFSGYQKKLICEMTGRGRTTILRWCHLYNDEKILGLRNKGNKGRWAALCETIGREVLENVLSQQR